MPIEPFWNGLLVTLQLCVISGVGALILGALIAALRVSPLPPLRAVGTAYVTMFRNIPLTVVLFFAGFGLPELGITHAEFFNIPGLNWLFPSLASDIFFRFAIIALVTYTAAFVCEALRSGVNAVPHGQAEAARSLGLTFSQNLRHIVFPQAWKFAIVPLGSVIIAMLKNSALAGALGGVQFDLFYTVEYLTSSSTVESAATTFEAFIGVSIGYLIMTVPLGLLLDRVEKRRAAAR